MSFIRRWIALHKVRAIVLCVLLVLLVLRGVTVPIQSEATRAQLIGAGLFLWVVIAIPVVFIMRKKDSKDARENAKEPAA